jgi:hypothetical protein
MHCGILAFLFFFWSSKVPFENLAYRVRAFLAPPRGFGWRTEIDPPSPDDPSRYAQLARHWIKLGKRLLWEGAQSSFPVPGLSDDEREFLSETVLGQELLRFCGAVEDLAASRQSAP